MIRFSRMYVAVLPLALFALTGCPKPTDSGSGGGGGTTTGSATAAGSTSAATTASAAPAAASTIKFAKKDWEVGSSYTENKTVSMKLDFTKPAKLNLASDEKTSMKVEVLGANGKSITKAKVTYTSAQEKRTEDGNDKTVTSPVNGNTYIAESSGGTINVTDGNHKPVSAKEADKVAKDFDTLGKPDPLLAAIPDVELKVGDKADSLADALKEEFDKGGDATIEKASVTLKEIKNDGDKAGVFDIKMSFKVTDEGSTISFDIDGTMTVREKDARVLGFDVKGPITFSGPLTAKGTMTANDDFKY